MIENRPDISLLHLFRPSETALLDWLKPHITDSMLHEIAAADYGYEAEAYFKALKAIRDHQLIPVPLRWIPREVLELMRWSEPNDPTWKPGSKGRRGHLFRAFSCAVLLKAGDEPETQEYLSSENETLIQLIASVLLLGREASECALRFLCWRISQLSSHHEETPFFLLGLLLLRVALFELQQEEADFILLAEWIVAEEARQRAENSRSEEWLLGLTFHDQKHETWRNLTKEILLDTKKAFSEPTATALRNIVTRLVYGSG